MRRLAKPFVLALALIAALGAGAQSSTSDDIAKYRAMIADGNPADLWEAKGEALWAQPRGPKKASLQQCDLGKGPGVVKGAFVELPRYFADTKRVQDMESRLLTCMQELQGFDAAEIAKTPFGRGEQVTLESLVAFVSAGSRGMRFAVPQAAPEEKDMYEIGKRAFHFHGGPYDFACASCHGQGGKRIRMQDLPEPHPGPGRRRGLRWLAGVSGLERRAVEHAAPFERLFPPAALSVPGLHLRRDDRARGLPRCHRPWRGIGRPGFEAMRSMALESLRSGSVWCWPPSVWPQ